MNKIKGNQKNTGRKPEEMGNRGKLADIRSSWTEYKKRSRRNFFERQKRLQEQLNQYGWDILHSENFDRCKKNRQHGNISVKEHSIRVARQSIALADRLGVAYNREDLIRGALLHDYFLYDWHKNDKINPHRLHGFHHPARALKNAEREYKLTEKQREIIIKHMWTLTIKPPMCREAWMVTAADKYCSFMETAHLQKGHRRKRNEEFI